MKRILVFIAFVLFSRGFSQTYTFTTTTSNATNSWDSGNNFTGFQKTITVSGVPTTGYVLRQVNVYMGDGSTGDALSLYAAQLVAPNTNTITLFNTGYFYNTTFNKYLNIHLRDHSQLKRPVDYSGVTGGFYYYGSPYYYGYYRVETANSFTLAPTDPNGNWTFQMKESSSGNEMAFNKVELVFGPAFVVTDIRSSTTYDNCALAQCMQTGDIFWGTNTGFTNAGANDPTLTIGSCNWNAIKNNSAWFYFTASATTANFSISGFSNYQESVVFQMGGSGCTGPTFSLVQCPVTQMFDPNAPTTTSTNNYWYNRVAWASGFPFNHEYSLTGLSVGQNYILVIDGQSGNQTDYYLEMKTGGDNGCTIMLPVTLIDFKGTASETGVNLKWIMADEKNIHKYVLERSYDAVTFEDIPESHIIPGNKAGLTTYNFTDTRIVNDVVYYRLRANQIDGSKLYFNNIIAVNKYNRKNAAVVFPNPASGNFILKFSSELPAEGVKYFIRDVNGLLVKEGTVYSSGEKIEMQSTGVYVLETISGEESQFQKIIVHPGN